MEQELINKLLKTQQTPIYVFDIRVLKERLKYLRSVLPEEVLICYAVKANTFTMGEMQEADRFEVCSPGELSIYREMNLPEEKLVVSGVYKTPQVMDDSISHSLTDCIYTVESITQFSLFEKLSRKYKKDLKVLLRLTSGSQFGLNEDEIFGIISNINDYPFIKIKGLQYFSGTQKKSLKRMKREIEYTDDFMCRVKDETGFIFDELEFGTGFPVAYFSDDEFDENKYFDEFNELLKGRKYNCRLILEIGRSISASCGSYLTTIVDKKTNKNENYIICDGGMNHIVYFGQSMAMKQPEYELFPERSGDRKELWNICGSLCTVNDLLVKQLPMNSPDLGDVIVFKNTGAYCMTEGISLFLSRALPAVCLIDEDGNIKTVRENIETYKLNKAEERK